LNLRFRLEREDVSEHLEIIARNMGGAVAGEEQALGVGATTAQVLTTRINEDYFALLAQASAEGLSDDERADLRRQAQDAGVTQIDAIRPNRPIPGDLRDAEEDIENWGAVIVPFLYELATDYVHLVPANSDDPWFDGFGASSAALGVDGLSTGELSVEGERMRIHPSLTRKVRFLAVQRLSQNGQRRIIFEAGEQASDEERALNREIVEENSTIGTWVYDIDASEPTIEATLAEWTVWYDLNRGRFERTSGENVRMALFDTRFAKYCSNLMALDLGTSIKFRRPVVEVIGEHWRYSIFLSLTSLLLAYFISVPLGVLAAVKQNQFADRGIGLMLFVLYSLPSFFAASLLQSNITGASEIEFFRWFPVAGFQGVSSTEVTSIALLKDIIWHLVLPIVCLTYGSLAVLSRYARTGMLDVIRSDYIRTARAKGLSEWVVILKHAVRNGMIPILTLLGTTLPVVIGGSIVIEFIFSIQGMGALMLGSIGARDYNVILGVLLLSAVLTLVGILLSDISYALVDPRISFD
jgi:peptide/nickel transport system permease protein